MAHKIARLLLEHADTFLERTEAVETALYLGMPLQEIEEYLDWLDMMKAQPDDKSFDEDSDSVSDRRDRREKPNAD